MSLWESYNESMGNAGVTNVAADMSVTVENAYEMVTAAEEQNRSVFESVIKMDALNLMVQNGAVNESSFVALNEASVKDIIDRILSAITSFGEKVKGIIMNLIHKFQALFTSDGEKLVKNHEKQINEKINKQLMSKFKYKYAEFKNPEINVLDKLNVAGMPGANIKSELTRATNLSSVNSDLDGDATVKLTTSDEISEEKNKFLSSLINGGGSTDVKSFKKDFYESVFGDAEEKEGFGSDIFNKIKTTLKGHKKLIDGLKKEQRETDKVISGWKTSATELQRKLDKASSGDNYKLAQKNASVLVSNAMTHITAASIVSSMAFSAIADAYKKDYRQAKAIFVKAVGFNGKVQIESAEEVLDDAIVEAALWESDEIWAEA